MAKWNVDRATKNQTLEDGYAYVKTNDTIYKVELTDFKIVPAATENSIEFVGILRERMTSNSKPRHTAPNDTPLDP